MESAASKRLELVYNVSLQVSDPYNKTDLTLEFKILKFVHKEMYRDLETGLNVKKQLARSYSTSHF